MATSLDQAGLWTLRLHLLGPSSFASQASSTRLQPVGWSPKVVRGRALCCASVRTLGVGSNFGSGNGKSSWLRGGKGALLSRLLTSRSRKRSLPDCQSLPRADGTTFELGEGVVARDVENGKARSSRNEEVRSNDKAIAMGGVEDAESAEADGPSHAASENGPKGPSLDEEQIGQVPEGSAAFQMARSLLTSLSQSMEGLAKGMSKQEEELASTAAQIEEIVTQGSSREPAARVSRTALTEAEGQVMKLTARLTGLQRELEAKEVEVMAVKQEAIRAESRLRETEAAEATLVALRRELEQRDLRLSALAVDLSHQATTGEEKETLAQEALHAAELRISELMSHVAYLQEDLSMRDVVLEQLQTESNLSTHTLQEVAQAMSEVQAEKASLQVELERQRELVGQSKEEIAALLGRIAEKDVEAKAAADRMARLEGLVHELDANLEQENARKQEAESLVQRTKEEVTRAKKRVEDLESSVRELREKVRQRDQQAALRDRELQEMRQALQQAKQTVEDLNRKAEESNDALREEIVASSAALKSAASREQDLRLAQQQVRELTREATSLRALVESKEQTMAALKEETHRNAETLMAAAKTRETLQHAESRLEHLREQVQSLEMEVRSRDELLDDIKEETYKSVQALKMAAQVNQHLAVAREREAELEATLEEREDILDNLRRELAENLRAVRAEQALRAMEARARELAAHNETLRLGIERRDGVIASLSKEVEEKAEMLGSAADTREELQKVRERSGELEGQLQQQSASIGILRETLSSALTHRTAAQPKQQPQQQQQQQQAKGLALKQQGLREGGDQGDSLRAGEVSGGSSSYNHRRRRRRHTARREESTDKGREL